MIATWRPGFNDPELADWAITLAYLTAAVLSLQAMRRSPPGRQGSRSSATVFWCCVGLLMLALGLNKQLDLQTALADWGRQMAREQGWYKERREFQRRFIWGLAGCSVLVIGWLTWRIRRSRWPCWLALAGVVMQVLYILVRATSFHHVDRILGARIWDVKTHVWAELLGILLVGSAACLHILLGRNRRKKRGPRFQYGKGGA
ncbi:MAG: hypothetical protein ACLFVU_08300 [Phycisphaerae bacterium]